MGRRTSSNNAIISLLLLSLPSFIRGEDAINHTRIIKHMMPIEDLNDILMTETSADFGTPLTSDETEEKWVEATLFKWDYNHVDRSETLGDGHNYDNYAICSSVPGLSGNERFNAIFDLLEEAANGTDSLIFESESIYNDDDKTCRLVSTTASVFKTVVEDNSAESLQYLQVQPQVSSMKMIEGTFDKIMNTMLAYDCTDECAEDTVPVVIASTGGRRNRALRRASRSLNGEAGAEPTRLALILSLSPIVLHFAREDEGTYENVINDLKEFITKAQNVKDASFYVHAASKGEKVSDRMQFYADVVANVTAMVDASTGKNLCMENIVRDDIHFESLKSNETIAVTIKTITGELTEAQLDDCLWYMVHALTLHPYVDLLDTKPVVVTLPEPPTGAPAPPTGETSGAPSSVLSTGLAAMAVASVSWLLQSAL